MAVIVVGVGRQLKRRGGEGGEGRGGRDRNLREGNEEVRVEVAEA